MVKHYLRRLVTISWGDSRTTISGAVQLRVCHRHVMRSSDDVSATGDVQAEAGMANVLFDFRKDKRVSPYVGAGVGVAEIELTDF